MTQKMQKLSFLNEQISIPAKDLTLPAPDAKQLEAILQTAMSSPDHGELTPFRFLIIQDEALAELSEVFRQAAIQRGANDSTVLKQQKKPLRSPMIITVIATINDNPSIPEVEQILCAGVAAQHIQLACRNLNFGSIWLTGENCYDLYVYQALGLELNERIIGFLYVGTPSNTNMKKNRYSAKKITRFWKTSQHTDFAI